MGYICRTIGVQMTTYHGEMNMLTTFRMFHGGNGTTPVDSALPLQGIFYGLKGQSFIGYRGFLEWNRYLGRGEPWWHPANEHNWDYNTGNLIRNGNDFGDIYINHVFGCGDGDIMAVHRNGNLHWYSYKGKGEDDVNGTLGWHPNSGNVIGNGWQNFIHIFVRPYSGWSSTARLEIFAVEQKGGLRWYSYNGNGENDPSGTLGWHPNSGKRIGPGWQNWADFRHIHGSGRDIFAINQYGEMQWFQYNGNGEEHPSGTVGWHPNSGHVIDRSLDWRNMKFVFGGVADIGGFGHVIMAVDKDDNLFWSKYTGQGEGPEINWDFNSGTCIGRVPFVKATHSVVVHFKSLFPLSGERISWIREQFQAMHELFAQGGIAVYKGTMEDLSNIPNLEELRVISVGECRRFDEPSQEIIELFKNRNYVGSNELVVYIVDYLITSTGHGAGCANHPIGKPGAIVGNYGSGGFRWMVAHEVAHVLGLDHTSNQDNLMYEGGVQFVTNLPPNLTDTDYNKLHASPFCRPCKTIVSTGSPPF